MIWIIIWNILYAFLLIVMIPASLFNRKIRLGLWKRIGLLRTVKQWRQSHPGPVISIHSASYGEFEHIRPLIHQIKQNSKKQVVVLFFSPSGYEYLKKDPLIDGAFYSPFDFLWSSQRFFSILKPEKHIVAKHDVWPGQVYAVHRARILLYLVNASLSQNSTRVKFFSSFQSYFYRLFDAIYAISEEDKERFQRYFSLLPEKIQVVGDTKNDQVNFRKEKALKEPVFPNLKKNREFIFVAGSIWEEDWRVLKDSLIQLMQDQADLHVILCPHELKTSFIQKIKNDLEAFEPVVITEQDNTADFNSFPRVMIIDRMGILADIYSYAEIAFVGGSFKGKVHNVLEPAVYGIPVVTGPFIKNSTEALMLQQKGALFVVENEEKFYHIFNKLRIEETLREECGKKANEFVLSRTHVSEKILTSIFNVRKRNEGKR